MPSLCSIRYNEFSDYLYLIFSARTDEMKIKEIALVSIRGKSFKKIPYTSHNETPAVRVMYISREISCVF